MAKVRNYNAKSTLEVLLNLTMDDEMVKYAAYELPHRAFFQTSPNSSPSRLKNTARASELRAVREALTDFNSDKLADALSIANQESAAKRSSLLFATWDTRGGTIECGKTCSLVFTPSSGCV